jgi:CDP-diacylglycerol--serine O-phosphatidyltransferase
MLMSENSVGLSANDIEVQNTPAQFKQLLLAKISSAKTRIYISVLYLQDDDAGREILTALYEAKQNQPQLDICIFVDFHRAQRGLIGEKRQGGNRELYLAYESKYSVSIDIYGVAVKRKELLGVLHLKGMVIDDLLLYTGASLNDVYLHQQQRYRLDRYYQLNNIELANSFCDYLQTSFVKSGLSPLLNQGELPDKLTTKRDTIRLTKYLKSATYTLNEAPLDADIQASMFVGCGRRGNHLNRIIRQLVKDSQQTLIMFTPYFNLPKPLLKDVDAALRRGVKVTLTIGDKTANDFYNSDPESFSTVEIVPYIYETLLVSFLKRRKKYIDSGQLTVQIWQDGNNSFHLKGIVVDQRFHLLTGSNLNPRAWARDLENGILLDDVKGHLLEKFNTEFTYISRFTQKITQVEQLESSKDYPEKPRKLLKRIRMTQIDRILKRFL